MVPLYRPLEVAGALFPMSKFTLSKSSEAGSALEGPKGSEVANGLSAFGLPSIFTSVAFCCARFLAAFNHGLERHAGEAF